MPGIPGSGPWGIGGGAGMGAPAANPDIALATTGGGPDCGCCRGPVAKSVWGLLCCACFAFI